MTSYESYEKQLNHPKPANTLRDRIENIILVKTTATPDDAEDATRKIIDDLHLMHYEFTNHDGTQRQHVHGWWEE